MKIKITFLFIFFCVLFFAQNEFITLWQPNLASTTNNTKIYFPGVGSNYTIYWEEVGNPSHNKTLTNVTIGVNTSLGIDFGTGLSSDAQYILKISNGNGSFSNFDGASGIERNELLEVKQWGNIKWTTMKYAFYRYVNLDITATDIPDLSKVTSLSTMFYECSNLKGNSSFSLWNTSNILEMDGVFSKATNFNQNISNWNTSNVTTMVLMFGGATNFNQNIGGWDISKVTNLSSMFAKATNFNQNIENWNTSNVIFISSLFNEATNFNQNISKWNTSKVIDMSWMFSYATNFNQNIGYWDTSNVINMSYMFVKADNFNQDISNWDTSNVTDMSFMFAETNNFNQDIGNWNVSKVINMSSMFAYTSKFNQDIGKWTTSNLLDMGNLFRNAASFNKSLRNWDVSKVQNMQRMFMNASSYNQSIENWNIKSVIGIYNIFQNSNLSCENYDKTLIGWANNSNTPNNLQFTDNSNTIYSSQEAVNARNYLINTKGWTISGDSYNPSCALATNELQTKKIQVYPNPAKEYILIDNLKNNTEFEIYDVQGKRVKKEKYKNSQISLKNLTKGVYIIKIPSENYSQKIIVE